ncbi:hypothetical protein D3C80_1611640 [compost metagenome]
MPPAMVSFRSEKSRLRNASVFSRLENRVFSPVMPTKRSLRRIHSTRLASRGLAIRMFLPPAPVNIIRFAVREKI